ncbi:MAG: hypothetical protein F8N37_21495 [Telmatospirillum sp.]|nr:hypothetical protein [Telmatospirillum sp.]
MIDQFGIRVSHDSARGKTLLVDATRNLALELDHCGLSADPGKVERTMFRAYCLGGTRGLLGCFGAERIRHC